MHTRSNKMFILPLLLIPLGVGAALSTIGQSRTMSDSTYTALLRNDTVWVPEEFPPIQDDSKALPARTDTVEKDSMEGEKEPYGSIMNPYRFRADSTIIPEDSVALLDTVVRPREVSFPIMVAARAYGDSIVLRFAALEFAPWRLGLQYGYCITRICDDGEVKEIVVEEPDTIDERREKDNGIDTLEHSFMPLTLEQMQQRFLPTDSMAGVAAQMMWKAGSTLEDVVKTAKATGQGNGMSAVMELYDEQQTRYAYALMIAEFRADLAEAMCMRYTDRNVVKGRHYSYYITSLVPDDELKVNTGTVEVDNVPYVHPPFEPEITDSVSSGNDIILYWPLNAGGYTAYDIERRTPGGEWKRLNNRPFITYSSDENPAYQNQYTDKVEELGEYEYRIRGYDSFAENGPWSPVYSLNHGDIIPPMPPTITFMHVDRSDSVDVFVDVHFFKDSLESDLTGYKIYYYNEIASDNWIPLHDDLIPPGDTVKRVQINDLPSGMIVISSVDEAGNMASSMPKPIVLDDVTPPSAPDGLEYTMLPSGIVELRWSPNPERDVRGYQLYAANDTTHAWQQVKGLGVITDTITYDTTVVTGLNQRYIYYRLKAVDYAGNSSEFSAPLQVQRLSYDKPIACVVDTVWQNDSTVFIDWRTQAEHNVIAYRMYRRQKGDNSPWVIVQLVDANQVPGNIVHTQDQPPIDRKNRYFYAIEAVSTAHIVSDLSYPVPVRHNGPDLINVPVTLTATYDSKARQLVMDWNTSADAPEGYWCYMEIDRGNGEFEPLASYEANEKHVRLGRLKGVSSGMTINVRAQLRWFDDRYSPMSNVVRVNVTEGEQ